VPDGNAVVVIFRDTGAIVTAIVADCVCTGLPLSWTDAVNVDVPAALGVPKIAPLAARESPAGRLPEITDQE
jgi:hypothetical protein